MLATYGWGDGIRTCDILELCESLSLSRSLLSRRVTNLVYIFLK